MLTPHQKQSILLHLEKAWEAANELPTTTPCLCCKFYDIDVKKCMFYDAIVPAEAAEAGCDQFEFNPESVPF